MNLGGNFKKALDRKRNKREKAKEQSGDGPSSAVTGRCSDQSRKTTTETLSPSSPRRESRKASPSPSPTANGSSTIEAAGSPPSSRKSRARKASDVDTGTQFMSPHRSHSLSAPEGVSVDVREINGRGGSAINGYAPTFDFSGGYELASADGDGRRGSDVERDSVVVTVGGRTFTLQREWIENERGRDSLLEAWLFSGRWDSGNDSSLKELNGDAFELVLEWLKTGNITVPPPLSTEIEEVGVLNPQACSGKQQEEQNDTATTKEGKEDEAELQTTDNSLKRREEIDDSKLEEQNEDDSGDHKNEKAEAENVSKEQVSSNVSNNAASQQPQEEREMPQEIVDALLEIGQFLILDQLMTYVDSRFNRPEMNRDLIKFLLEREPPVVDLSAARLFKLHLGHLSFCHPTQYDTDLQVGSVPKPTAGCAVISSSETSSSCSPSSSSSSPTARLRLVTFEGSDLRDCNLSGCELAGAVFRDACCDGAVMSGAKLHGADFTGADTAGLCLDNAFVVGALLDGCDLSRRPFRETHFVFPSVSKATMTSSHFSSCIFTGVDFSTLESLDAAVLANGEITGSRKWMNCFFVGANLSGCSFAGRSFDGSDFSNANLAGCDFENALMPNIRMNGAKVDEKTVFRGCSFEDAEISELSFHSLNLSACNFKGAALTDCDLSECRTDANTQFCETSLVRVSAHNCAKLKILRPRELSHCNFTRTSLRSSHFSKLNLAESKMIECDLSAVVFDQCSGMSKCNLSKSILANTQFTGMDMKEMSLPGADLSSVEFTQCDLSNSTFSGAHMPSSVFVECSLPRCRFDRAVLQGSRFDDVTRKNMVGVCLAGCRLPHVDLSNANLTRADLHRAVFTNASFANSNLKEVKADMISADDCSFCNANLANGSFNHCSLFRANFNQANLVNASVRSSQLQRVAMKNCSIGGADFSHSRLNFSVLTGLASTKGSKFDGCDLTCVTWVPLADVKKAYANRKGKKKIAYLCELRNVSFRHAKMKGADLRLIDCKGACFDKADLRNAILTDCGEVDTKGAILDRALV